MAGLHVVGGVVDPDYRGSIKVVLENRSPLELKVHKGERIAQLIVERYERVRLEDVAHIVDILPTMRGDAGLGSTGLFGVI